MGRTVLSGKNYFPPMFLTVVDTLHMYVNLIIYTNLQILKLLSKTSIYNVTILNYLVPVTHSFYFLLLCFKTRNV